MTAERQKQNSNKILTVMRVPDTRGETKDGEGPAGDTAADAGTGGQNGNDGDGAGVW